MSATLSLPTRYDFDFEPCFPSQPAVEAAAETQVDLKSWCVARADEWYARGEKRAARDFLQHAAAIDASDAEVWLALGSLHFELGNLEQAGLAFHMAGELTPTDARVFLHLGLVHQRLNQNEDAEGLFKHAVALDPANVLAKSLFGTFLLAGERFAEARTQFAQALQRQPNDIQLLLQLGVCCFKTKDAAAARTCYERVLRLSPGHALATENLGALNLFSASAALLH